MTNGILHRGDKIALMVPIFTPYLEIPQLERYDFDVVEISASMIDRDGVHTWHYPTPSSTSWPTRVKARVPGQPSNPPSMAMLGAASATGWPRSCGPRTPT